MSRAEHFHAQLTASARPPLNPRPERWQDIVRRRQIAGAAFLNQHPAALRLFMGAGVSAEVRNLDLRGNGSLAATRAAEFRHWFNCRAIPDLQHHLSISVEVMDGVSAISWSQHHCITDSYREAATRASIGHLRTILPEDLPWRRDDSWQNLLSLFRPDSGGIRFPRPRRRTCRNPASLRILEDLLPLHRGIDPRIWSR